MGRGNLLVLDMNIPLDRLDLLKWHYCERVRAAKQELDSLKEKLAFLEQCEQEALLVKESVPSPPKTEKEEP